MSAAPPRSEQERAALEHDVRAALRDVHDFPQPGVVFKDVTPVLLDADLSARVVAEVVGRHHGEVDLVVGIEARGFILGSVVAHELGVGFVPVRKEGKLPADRHTVDYDLEYGSATVEMHIDAVRAGQRVLVYDDVLASGGTAAAAADLVRRCGGQVAGVDVLIEITALAGRDRLDGIPVRSLVAG
jgi:adenine phosphoribosyltransferase